MWSGRALRGSGSRGRLWAAAALPFACAVREHAASAVDTDSVPPPIAENERVEKRWEINQSKAHAINSVQINVPGLTFVRYDPGPQASETMATVRVTGDSSALVECVDVVPLPPNGVKLRWKKSNECAQLRGHLLTTLSLTRQAQVNELQARGTAAVVVEDDVLLAECGHASVRIATEGTGDLFVTNTSGMDIKDLRLSTAGTGTLQFVCGGGLKLRDRLLLELAGNGNIHAFAGRVETKFLKSSIAGSGVITLTPASGLHVDKLKTSLVGDGKVVYDGEGDCRVQRCTIAGSGEVQAHGIRCSEASIEAFGEADVTLNVKDKIRARGWSSTTVRYVGEKPSAIEGKAISLRPALPISAETRQRLEPAAAPVKEAAFKEIEAVYDSKLGDNEGVDGLRKLVRFFLNAFVDKDSSVCGDVKAEKAR